MVEVEVSLPKGLISTPAISLPLKQKIKKINFPAILQ